MPGETELDGSLEASRRKLRHDLRTPINHITNYSQLAREDLEDWGLHHLSLEVAGILAAAATALELINGWLDPRHDRDRVDEAPPALEQAARDIIRRAERTVGGAVAANISADTVNDLTRIAEAGRALLGMLEGPASAASGAVAELSSGEMSRRGDLVERDRATGAQTATILVVDDNQLNRHGLGRMLNRLGHDVAFAEHGRRALEVLASQRIDLVLLDIMMPELNGYQVLEARRENPTLRDIPFVVVSGLDDMESVGRCIELGAEDYLTKPFDVIHLKARVAACIEKKRWRDQELAYLQSVSVIAGAAVAVEQKTFNPESLAQVAQRSDELGNLARVIQHMAREVYAREARLAEQVHRLSVQVDEARKARQVEEITSSAYFQSLQQRARALRSRSAEDREKGQR